MTIPPRYWALSLRPSYRGASQEALDSLLAECRAEVEASRPIDTEGSHEPGDAYR
jgi:hypothetical protein